MSLLEEAKKIRNLGIISLILMLTVVGFFISFVIDIICGIKILSRDWKNIELNNQKLIWAILCFILLGPIAAIVFGCVAYSKLSDTNIINV